MTCENPPEGMGAPLGTERSPCSGLCSWGSGLDLGPTISHAGDPERPTVRWQGLLRPHRPAKAECGGS